MEPLTGLLAGRKRMGQVNVEIVVVLDGVICEFF
jgi:hypothetical protein